MSLAGGTGSPPHLPAQAVKDQWAPHWHEHRCAFNPLSLDHAGACAVGFWLVWFSGLSDGVKPGVSRFFGCSYRAFRRLVVFGVLVLTETVSCRFGETHSRLPLAGSVDLRLRTLKLPHSKHSLGANVVLFEVICKSTCKPARRRVPCDIRPSGIGRGDWSYRLGTGLAAGTRCC